MSLRTDYTGALDTKLAEARAAGRTFVVTTNLTTIGSEMTTAAASGLRSFTYTQTVSYQPEDLKLLGNLWSAFKTGIQQGLAEQDLMANEVTVALNTSDAANTKIDINFTF